MPTGSLHIAWVGAGPGQEESGGAPGVAAELLVGLARRGHRIDCFLPSAGRAIPERVSAEQNIRFVWGTSGWRWNRWYSRTRITAFVSGLVSRTLALLRLRREIALRHAEDPYDLVFSQNIEAPGLPRALTRRVPLVLDPGTHAAGELRFLVRERRLALRCQPLHVYAMALAAMAARSLGQRLRIRRAQLLLAISSTFRDHLVEDYGFPRERTRVIPNPLRLERFADVEPQPAERPVVLVLGRVTVRKGIEDVVAVVAALRERRPEVLVRIVGGPALWSDYTPLLADLPPNAEYVGRIPPAAIPLEIAGCDVLLQASRYEPFGLTVAEALASGVPVVATGEVGAIEGVSREVVAAVRAGDIEGMTSALLQMIDRVRADPAPIRERARSEVARLFASDVVCEQVAAALSELAAAGSAPAPDGTRTS